MNIYYKISQLKIEPKKQETEDGLKKRLKNKVSRLLSLPSPDCINDLAILKKSIDARKKNDIILIFTVYISVHEKYKICQSAHVEVYKENDYRLPEKLPHTAAQPVIAGFGPAGIFAAYILSLCGANPIVIERGEDSDMRTQTVGRYWMDQKLNKNSNVQFGEGGAGTFSDGKLNTGVKDRYGRISFVLDTLVKFGAPKEITYDQHPHVGTDKLKEIIKNLRSEIIKNGGTVIFNCCLTDIITQDGCISKIRLQNLNKEGFSDILKKYQVSQDYFELPAEYLILATGHSARDTFRMLHEKKLKMEAKPFACGFRFIHDQEMINAASYGEKYKDYFGAAPYKLTHNTKSGRGVYSFCMCPGGYVVDSSSEEKRICVNGMSYYGRASGFANSAIVVTVDKNDYKKAVLSADSSVSEDDPLIGMYYQELLEEETYKRGHGAVPVSSFFNFKNNDESVPINKKTASKAIKGQYNQAVLNGIFSKEIDDAIIEGIVSFGKKIKGYDSPDTLMAGCEMRTSSPVKIIRNENGEASINGIFPCGEGAGYAGGIVSAAVDGIKTAENILNRMIQVLK